jgi:hypothetical protein
MAFVLLRRLQACAGSIISNLALALLITNFPTLADSWLPPSEHIEKSDDGSKLVRSTPIKKGGADLAVFETAHADGKPLWTVQTTNTPLRLFVSNSASNIVTMDSYAHVGYGDYVIAIYSAKGELAHYKLTDFTLPPSSNNRNFSFFGGEYEGLFPHSTSSRWWNTEAFSFFSPIGKPSFFCIWLPWHPGWIPLDLTSGRLTRLNEQNREALNLRALSESHLDLSKPMDVSSNASNPELLRALKFVTWLRRPDDRQFLEKALHSRSFHVGFGAINSDACLFAHSDLRATADFLLDRWDRNTSSASYTPISSATPINLGELSGTITFGTPLKNGRSIKMCLVPAAQSSEAVRENDLEHSFLVSLEPSHLLEPRLLQLAKFRFQFSSIAPGNYHLRAILTKSTRTNADIHEPASGDWYSTNSPLIKVRPGESLKDLSIQCRTPR